MSYNLKDHLISKRNVELDSIGSNISIKGYRGCKNHDMKIQFLSKHLKKKKVLRNILKNLNDGQKYLLRCLLRNEGSLEYNELKSQFSSAYSSPYFYTVRSKIFNSGLYYEYKNTEDNEIIVSIPRDLRTYLSEILNINLNNFEEGPSDEESADLIKPEENINLLEEYLFKSEPIDFISQILPDRPCIFIYETNSDDSRNTIVLEIILKEYYREHKEDYPLGIIRNSPNPDEFEGTFNAEDKIVFIKNPKLQIDTNRYIDIDTITWSLIKRKFEELRLQRFGFIVIEIKEGMGDKLLENIKTKLGQNCPFIKLRPLLLSYNFKQDEYNKLFLDPSHVKYFKFCQILWGYIEIYTDAKLKQLIDMKNINTSEELNKEYNIKFNTLFQQCELKYYEILKEKSQSELCLSSGKFLPESLIILTENESLLHYYMKVFAVRCFSNKYKDLRDSDILTEEDARIGNIIPDIRIKERIVIEIERLYGTRNPMSKLAKTCQKYIQKYQNIDEIQVILKNLDILMYFRSILKLKESLNKIMDIKITFWTLNLKDEELISISDYGNDIKTAFISSEDDWLYCNDLHDDETDEDIDFEDEEEDDDDNDNDDDETDD